MSIPTPAHLETIPERVKQILADILRLEPDVLNDEGALAELRDWDSLKHLSIILALEEEFMVQVSPDQITGLTSYGKIVDWLRENHN